MGSLLMGLIRRLIPKPQTNETQIMTYLTLNKYEHTDDEGLFLGLEVNTYLPRKKKTLVVCVEITKGDFLKDGMYGCDGVLHYQIKDHKLDYTYDVIDCEYEDYKDIFELLYQELVQDMKNLQEELGVIN